MKSNLPRPTLLTDGFKHFPWSSKILFDFLADTASSSLILCKFREDAS